MKQAVSLDPKKRGLATKYTEIKNQKFFRKIYSKKNLTFVPISCIMFMKGENISKKKEEENEKQTTP